MTMRIPIQTEEPTPTPKPAEERPSDRELWKLAEEDAAGDDEEPDESEPERKPEPEKKAAKSDTDKDDDEPDDDKDKQPEKRASRAERNKLRAQMPPEVQVELRRLKSAANKRIRDAEDYARQKIEEVNRHAATATQKLGRFAEAERALERDDPDAFAKALGHESWSKLNGHWIKVVQSPEYRKIAELEQREQDRTEAAERAQKEQQARQAHERQQADRKRYVEALGKELGEHEDQGVSTLVAEDPDFIQLVVWEQQKRYKEHGALDEELEQEALEAALGTARKKYAILHKVFQGDVPESPSAAGSSRESSRKKPKSVPLTRQREASPSGELSPEQLRAHYIKELQSSEM